MTRANKKKALLILGIAVLVTAGLAVSLSQMELHPGLPSPILEGGHIIVAEPAQSGQVGLPFLSLVLRFIGILGALYLLVVLYQALMGAGWKNLTRTLIGFIVLLGVLLILIAVLSLLRTSPSQPGTLSPTPVPIAPSFTTQMKSAPAILIWVVGAGLALLAAFLLFRWINAHKKSGQAVLLTEQLETARQNILAGMDLEDVILHCYREMERILQQEGSIERQAFTTPAEFEVELCAVGLPRGPVHELTQLFEIVRYGQFNPSIADEQAALSNLQEIIIYLRTKKGAGKDE